MIERTALIFLAVWFAAVLTYGLYRAAKEPAENV